MGDVSIPFYLFAGATALLLIAVALVYVWMRRRREQLVERLESKSRTRLDELGRRRDEQLDRLEREWEGKLERAPLELARDLLSTYDAIENALHMLEDSPAERPDGEVAEGLRLIRREFLAALAAHDIEIVAPQAGSRFDPDIHEAFDVVEAGNDTPDGSVAECKRVGFRHPAAVLRPALVTVAGEDSAG